MTQGPDEGNSGSNTGEQAPAAPPPVRIQENVLARSERKLLNAICARLPGWVTPDMMTFLGMVGAVLVFAGYLLSNLGENWLFLAIAGYAVQWFGDSTDGSLARFRKIERGSPVDTSGGIGYVSGYGVGEDLEGDVANVREMMERLARSPLVRQSFIRHVFRFWMGRNELLRDSSTLLAMDQAYVSSSGSFKEVLVALLTSDSFLYRK